MRTHIIIGTRGSELALAQAHEVRDRLLACHGHDCLEVEIKTISTKGDRVLDRALSAIGGKGLFTEEIEAQLLSGEIDIAVHSTKDMPTQLPQGLALSCYLPREDPGDVFISNKAQSLMDLKPGSVVGSASLRRQALILSLRPDVSVITFRGNVQTRLKKLEAGEVDATLLAQAGLNRMGMQDIITAKLAVEEFVPAPGQGAICIESRVGDADTDRLVGPLDDADTRTALIAERSFLGELDGSCRTPLAAYAQLIGSEWHLDAMIMSPDGKQIYRTKRNGTASDAHVMGRDAAQELRKRAGDEFFSDWLH